ncbi:MAG: hypothetical protein MK207_13480 [Saprospiraceae bacterium]|nr:hypothetical protein [Saprospiraceae bacterium]
MMKLEKNFLKELLFGNFLLFFLNTFPIAFFIFAVSGCQNDSKKNIIESKMLDINGSAISLRITTNYAVIRKNPSINSPEISRKMKGDSVLFNNKITPYNRSIKIEGIQYNEPWLQILLEENKFGWIYGGCIDFKASKNVQLKEKVLDQRALNFFGPSLAQQITTYHNKAQNITTLSAFNSIFSMSQLLKDNLEDYMNLNIPMLKSTQLPDFFWLNELIDGMLVHYIPEHQKYYLFKDLKYWQKISQKTLEPEDNNFIELLMAIYPEDSIEYIYYGWELPIDSTITCSLLGSDIHYNILEKMILVSSDSNKYFKLETQKLKQALVDDISKNKHYWMPLDSIQKELTYIIDKNFKCLEKHDWIAIKTQKKILNEHQKNNIQINLFDGR